MAMIKMHCKKGKSCIKSVLIVLLWLLAFVATIYVVNPHFIDAYIVPRWLEFGILYSLLFSGFSVTADLPRCTWVRGS